MDAALVESAAILLVASGVVVCAVRSIQRCKCIASSGRVSRVPDDDFDIGLLGMFGLVLVVLNISTIAFLRKAMHMDQLVLEITMGVLALTLKNSVSLGVAFTVLAYTSWYGCFRMLETMPLGSDFFQLLSNVQWAKAIIAFGSTTLAAGLKYPYVMKTSPARYHYMLLGVACAVCYRSAALPAVVGCDLLGIDPIFVRFLLPPSSGGEEQGAETRGDGEFHWYHALVMLGLQTVTYCFTQWQITPDVLKRVAEDEELPDSWDGDKRTDSGPPRSSGGLIDSSENREYTNLQDLPEDCVEITEEEACRLQGEAGQRVANRHATASRPESSSDSQSSSAGVRFRSPAGSASASSR
jgi:hypothetical protein